ncbi:hypothetical protein [Streptomyces sp. NPDC097610]|uniref:hypothetical protein n=1 Tax=Streptomyces sp. NPDC097610 TaxID=3157227 RepID=UPI003331A960
MSGTRYPDVADRREAHVATAAPVKAEAVRLVREFWRLLSVADAMIPAHDSEGGPLLGSGDIGPFGNDVRGIGLVRRPRPPQ